VPTSLTLDWPIAGDDGIYGQAASYEAKYSAMPITLANWDTATPVPGDIMASSLPGMMETVITGLTADQEYYVAVKATDDQGLVSGLSNVLTAKTINQITLYVTSRAPATMRPSKKLSWPPLSGTWSWSDRAAIPGPTRPRAIRCMA
jgi:hypothetical protein